MTTTKAMESAALYASPKFSKSEAKTEKNDMFSQFLDLGSVSAQKETTSSKPGIVNMAKNSITSYDRTVNNTDSEVFEEKEPRQIEEVKNEEVNETKKAEDKEVKDTVTQTKETDRPEKEVEDVSEEPLEKRLLKLSKALKDKLCEVLGISPEQLDEFLADSQLTLLSLFNQENLMDFAMMLSGSGDMSQILTDENAQRILQAVTDVVNEIDVTSITGISREELSELVTDVLEGNFTTKEANTNKTEEIVVNNSAQTVDVSQPMQENEDVVQVQTQEVEAEVNNADNDNVSNDDADNSEVKTLTIDVDNEASKKESFTGNENSKDSTLEVFTENLTAALNQTVATKEVSFANQITHVREVKQVIDQIVTQIKLTVTKDAQSIQMQLNPENLGRVNMTVTSKGGVMTAQFIVESEVAKEAIEAQIKVLIDNLNDQGLKVEDIEVTTRQFSFDQNAPNDSQTNQGSSSKKTFNGELFAEEITQAEQTQEIINENNTVSYLA